MFRAKTFRYLNNDGNVHITLILSSKLGNALAFESEGAVQSRFPLPVQRSVLEGYLTEGELNQLKKELQGCINTEEDQVRAYVMGSTRYMQVHQLGLANDGPKLFL